MLVSALVLAALPAAAAVASADYEQVVEITFPTDPRATYGDDYHQPRGGGSRTHRATDLMGERGWDVYAARAGTITWIPSDPHGSAGYAMYVRGDDGRTYGYMHLDSYAAGMAEGVEVARGQVIGTLGSSGNAGSPHLHFEIHDDAVTDPYGGNRLNPYPSLLAAEEGQAYATGAPGAPVDRIGGSERVATAALLSESAFREGADTVVLASAASYADAIVAGPLAAVLGGPVLTTYPGGLHEQARSELERLGATEVVLVDGSGSLGEQVVRDLEDAGIAPEAVTRIAGTTSAEVAAAVAARVWERTGQRDALVALGSHPEPSRAWPDALTGGYYGAVRGLPVLLTDLDALPEATAAALEGTGTVTVVGGTAAISAELAGDIGDRAEAVRRLSGTNRYATAAAVAGDLLDRGAVAPSRVWAATGREFADALAAAPVVAEHGDVLVLVDGEVSAGDAPVDDWLAARDETFARGRVIGGTAAISEQARDLLAERLAR